MRPQEVRFRALSEMAAEQLTWIKSASDARFRLAPSNRVPRFRVGDIDFRCSFADSDHRLFSIQKDRGQIEEYLEILEGFQRENCVELGIGSGGSAALTALVAPPRKLVAFDIRPDRIEPLDELIAERGLGDRVRLHYGVDQADRERLSAILEEEFGDEPLGLVIDDASHRLEETRASFETLFPRLRPDGLFVIEDWNHQHLVSRDLAAALAHPTPELTARFERCLAEPRDPPLTRLVTELILAQAESEEFVREVRLDVRWARVRRGSGELDPSEFRLEDLFTYHLGLLADK
jgi:predicted O-methyltransferase YrrM